MLEARAYYKSRRVGLGREFGLAIEVLIVRMADNPLQFPGINMFLLIATIAAVGRTTMSFVIALSLSLPAVWFQYVGLWHDRDRDLTWSWMFSAALYFITTAYLAGVYPPRETYTDGAA